VVVRCALLIVGMTFRAAVAPAVSAGTASGIAHVVAVRVIVIVVGTYLAQ
jgi:hypothetical protein